MSSKVQSKLAVWKFASCDGCQLTLLDCEEELLSIADNITIAYFPEATRAVVKGPYDLSLVEGSITTEQDKERIQEVREKSKIVICIGACATAGGIQALRNNQNIKEWVSVVYAHPEYISTLATSTPISDHIHVDFELRGCPINKNQLLEIISSFIHNKKSSIANESVCFDCKRKGNVCVAVTKNQPCLGPITHSGCGALCPTYQRPCYGCFGTNENANKQSLKRWVLKHNSVNKESWERLTHSYAQDKNSHEKK